MKKKTIQDYKIELENDVHLGHKEGWLDEAEAENDPLVIRSHGFDSGNAYCKTYAADGIYMSRLTYKYHLYRVWFEADGEGKFLHRSLYANGQTKQQYFLKNGKRHGKWKEFYEDGSPMCEIDCQEEVEVGKRKIWSRGGEVIEDEVDGRSEYPSYKEEVEENGVKKTIEREFFSDGSVLEESIDDGDRYEGRSYYPDGKLEHVVRTRKYVLDDDNGGVIPLAEGGWGARITLPDGIEERYYPNGNPWYRAPYKVGLLHGVKTYYYEDGSIESELPYEQGMLHGVLRRYYPDGTLRSETPYRYFKQFGVERTYRQDGSLDTSTIYVGGLKHGVQREYREDGSLRFENPYVEDKLDGCLRDYRHLNGEVFMEAMYGDGVLDGYAYCYDEWGEMVYSIEYRQGKAVNARDKEGNPLDLSLVRGEHPFTDFCMLLYGKELED